MITHYIHPEICTYILGLYIDYAYDNATIQCIDENFWTPRKPHLLKLEEYDKDHEKLCRVDIFIDTRLTEQINYNSRTGLKESHVYTNTNARKNTICTYYSYKGTRTRQYSIITNINLENNDKHIILYTHENVFGVGKYKICTAEEYSSGKYWEERKKSKHECNMYNGYCNFTDFCNVFSNNGQDEDGGYFTF
jgi:hypothetical protein